MCTRKIKEPKDHVQKKFGLIDSVSFLDTHSTKEESMKEAIELVESFSGYDRVYIVRILDCITLDPHSKVETVNKNGKWEEVKD